LIESGDLGIRTVAGDDRAENRNLDRPDDFSVDQDATDS